jgi:hypothetical protein
MKGILVFSDKTTQVVDDLHSLLNEANGGYLILGFLEVSLKDIQRELPKKDFSTISNVENLDLSVLFMGIDENGEEDVLSRWELGWEDGKGQIVLVYPKEFFENNPDAIKIFTEWTAFRLRESEEAIAAKIG